MRKLSNGRIDIGFIAMLAITGQDVPQEHQKTAKVWLNQLVTGPSKALIPYPFNLDVTSLVKATADRECKQQGRDTGQDVNTTPVTLDQPRDAQVSYLKGSSGFYRQKEEDRVRASRMSGSSRSAHELLPLRVRSEPAFWVPTDGRRVERFHDPTPFV